MWIYLHEYEPRVRAFLEETKAIEIQRKCRKLLNISFCAFERKKGFSLYNSLCSVYSLISIKSLKHNEYKASVLDY